MERGDVKSRQWGVFLQSISCVGPYPANDNLGLLGFVIKAQSSIFQTVGIGSLESP